MVEEFVESLVPSAYLRAIQMQEVNEDFTESVELGLVGGANFLVELWQLINVIPIFLCDGIVNDMEDLGGVGTEGWERWQIS